MGLAPDAGEITSDELAAILSNLGVRFLLSNASGVRRTVSPEELLTALAESKEARLRLALVPLLLCHPEYATAVRTVVDRLSGNAQLVLMCYYTAAHYILQRDLSIDTNHKVAMQTLPNLFVEELGLTPALQGNAGLRDLASRQMQLSRCELNWLGTYEHGARYWRAPLKEVQP